MGILDHLGLDHFYIGQPLNVFETWKSLVPLFPGATHKVVTSGADQWEGVYIPACDGTYFEIVLSGEPPNNYQSGVALSTRNGHYYDASVLAVERPELPWRKGLRVIRDNEPWFEYLMTWNDETTCAPLEMWTMKYFPAFKDPVLKPVMPGLRSFDGIEFE